MQYAHLSMQVLILEQIYGFFFIVLCSNSLLESVHKIDIEFGLHFDIFWCFLVIFVLF